MLSRISRQDQYLQDERVSRRSAVALILRTKDKFLEPTIENSEVLLIKRAAYEGDRWSGHIGLPGGKREPSDLSDTETAIRETKEEVGLDLNELGKCIGSLGQRRLKVAWGTKTLMILCPYVFQLQNPKVKLDLQDEVYAAGWVPLRSLVDKRNRVGHLTPLTAERLRLPLWLPNPVSNLIVKSIGNMVFDGIKIYPNELVYKNDLPGETPPFVLWGLTHAVFVDLLGTIDEYAPPVPQAWDLRLLTKLFTYNHVKSNRLHKLDAVSNILDGYFILTKRAVLIGVFLRLVVVSFLLYKLIFICIV